MGPKWPLPYKLEHEARRLAPWGLLDVKDPYEFSRRYIERLDRLDLDALVQTFEAISTQHGGQRLVLLCFEDVHAGQLCHRRLAAERLERKLGITVPEIEPGHQNQGGSGQLRLTLDDHPGGIPRRP